MSEDNKVIRFPKKELTINISYVAKDGSYFVELKNKDEVLAGVIYALEKTCKERLEEIKNRSE